MKIRLEEVLVNSASNKEREYYVYEQSNQGETCCGIILASFDEKKYRNVCMKVLSCETEEQRREAFNRFVQELEKIMPIFFKHFDGDEKQIRFLTDIGAELVEDVEGVTI